ncbi:NUMOD3 domain-containing DNA-binding protein [Ensifer canadensis]
MYTQFNKSKQTLQYVHSIRKARRQNRRKGDGTYYERHHIIPKCMGGSDAKSNLVLLTADEHFRAHWLLPDMVDDKNQKYKMLCALNRMTHSNSAQKRVGTVQLYAVARRKRSEAMIGRKLTDENRAKLIAANTGRKATAETRAKMSVTRTGKKRSDETKAKISAANRGRKITAETRAKMSESQKGKKHTAETIAKMSETQKGKKPTAETRAKMSESQKGKKHTAETRAKISAARKGKKCFNL